MLKHALDSGRERTVMFDSFSEDIGEKKCEENKIIFERKIANLQTAQNQILLLNFVLLLQVTYNNNKG